jgi:6-pyruvoyltetrahydropterin/6-carboxytetrahydropterin synthase
MPVTAFRIIKANAKTCMAIAMPWKSPCQATSSVRTMFLNFSDVKAIAKRAVVDVWDHAFLVYQHDAEVLNFLNSLANHKTVVFPTVPTAENMASEAFRILKDRYQDTYGNHLKLEKVRLYETPNSWADALA